MILLKSHHYVSYQQYCYRQLSKIFSILLSLLLLACSDLNGPGPEKGRVALKAETIAASFVRFKLEITSEQKYDAFAVYRGTELVKESPIMGTDTVFYNGGLNPATNYLYSAKLLKNGKEIDTSKALNVITSAVTSHDFSWRVDTLGIYGSNLWDVCAVNENSVWAVGVVNLDKPDTVWNTSSTRTTVVHWDGSEYTFHQVPIKNAGGSHTIQELYAVQAFSDTDVWVFSIAGSYAHWDGTKWESEFIPVSIGVPSKAWGVSSSNFYCVGSNGMIFHYNGSEFTLMESGVEEDLNDIDGLVDPQTGKTKLWVTGTLTLLHYNGDNWQIIQKRSEPVFPDNYNNPRSVYIPDNKNVILSLWSGPKARLTVLDQFNPREFYSFSTHNYFSYGMDGSSIDDIIVVSEFNALEHFNGQQFKTVTSFIGSGFFREVDRKKNSVFVVGSSGQYQALFINGAKY